VAPPVNDNNLFFLIKMKQNGLLSQLFSVTSQ